MPHYDELAVKHIWPQFEADDKISKYLPDHIQKDRGPSREYFFNVLNTLYPEYLQQILAHANKQRMTSEGEKGQRESIRIS